MGWRVLQMFANGRALQLVRLLFICLCKVNPLAPCRAADGRIELREIDLVERVRSECRGIGLPLCGHGFDDFRQNLMEELERSSMRLFCRQDICETERSSVLDLRG